MAIPGTVGVHFWNSKKKNVVKQKVCELFRGFAVYMV